MDLAQGKFGVGDQNREFDNCKKTQCGFQIWTVLHSVFTAITMTFVAGSVNGFTSPALLELTQHQDDRYKFDTTLSDIFGATSLVGAIFGGPIGGYVADRWGRKTALACNGIPYALGYFLVVMTSILPNAVAFKTILISSRFIAGIGQSWSLVVVSIYISEITFSRTRGLFVTLAEISIYLGALTMLGIGSISDMHYHYLALVPMAILSMNILMIIWIPETPRWLLLHFKDRPRAIAVLKYLKGPAISAEDKADSIKKASLKVTKLPVHQTLQKLFCQKENLIPFLVASLVAIHQQLCGFLALLNNIGYIFIKSKAPNPNFTGFLASLALLPGTLLCGVLVDIVGRKTLLMCGVVGMSISQALLGFQFHFSRTKDCHDDKMTESNSNFTFVDDDCSLNLYPVAIASVVMFLLSYSVSIGPINSILISEYFPLQVKGIANGILWSLNRLTGALIVGTFLNFSKWAGDWTAWWTLSIINCIAFVAITLFVVETKGVKLEHIPNIFKKRYAICLST